MTTVSHWCRTCTNHPTPLSQPSTHLLHKTPHMCSEQEKFSWYITYPYIYTCQQMSTAHERYVWHHTQELCQVAGLKLPLVAYINELRSLTAISLLITGVWTSAKTKTRVRSRFFLSYLTFFFIYALWHIYIWILHEMFRHIYRPAVCKLRCLRWTTRLCYLHAQRSDVSLSRAHAQVSIAAFPFLESWY